MGLIGASQEIFENVRHDGGVIAPFSVRCAMNTGTFRSDALLLITAAIWGFAFTAQRAGMDYIGPFLYTGIRFLLGAVVLLPVLFVRARKRRNDDKSGSRPAGMPIQPAAARDLLKVGVAAGAFLFLGVNFQQLGLLYTTAGKAGFITGLYVIIVPVMSMLWKQRSGLGTWAGAVIAVSGLYLLSITGGFRIGTGDLLVLVCSFFWACQILVIGRFAGRMDAIRLALVQYLFCGIVSLLIGFFVEPVDFSAIVDAALPLAYGGICSVGIAFTLQVIAQKSAPTAHAAIIMSLESVFAVIGGYIVLGETLSPRGISGCALMLCGMIISQMSIARSKAVARRGDAAAALNDPANR